jgi:hypothetical protein
MAIRPILRKALQTQIDWPLVGLAGAMAVVLVLSTTLAAWVASRSVNSVSRAARSPIGLGESSAGATQSVGDVRSHGERENEGLRDDAGRRDEGLVQQLPAASYPEGEEHAVAPGAIRSNGSAGASPSRTEQEGQRQPPSQIPASPGFCSQAGACEPEGSNEMHSQVAFAKDTTEAAVLAKQEHKLMFVLHVSGNFEESKFT